MGTSVRMLAVLQPMLSVLLVAALAAIPWGAPDTMEFALPMLALAVIHFWALRWSRLVPALFVFAVGVVLDLLTSGPVGYWALLYLLGYAAGAYGPNPRSGSLSQWALGAVTLVLVAVAGWFVGSIYFLQPVAVMSILGGTAVAALLYGLVIFVLSPVCPSIVEAYGPEHSALEAL